MTHRDLSHELPGGLTRRRFMAAALGTGGLVLLGGGTAWLGGRGLRLHSGTRPMMGTTATVTLAHDDPAAAGELLAAALDRMETVARRMSRYRDDSDVGRVNARTGRWVPMHPLTARVVETGLGLARASDGAFDPGLDRLTGLWGFHDRRAPDELPAGERLAAWRQRAAWRHIGLRQAGARPALRLADPAVGLDLGGIAKGFAVDHAVALLRERGVRHALVEAGGDLYALGRHPEGGPWRIGVRHPRAPERLLTTLTLAEGAVATSGDYENFFVAGGRRYAHLIDPRTARPAGHWQSLTVRADSAVLADALATGAFALPPAGARGLIARVGAGRWLGVDHEGRLRRG